MPFRTARLHVLVRKSTRPRFDKLPNYALLDLTLVCAWFGTNSQLDPYEVLGIKPDATVQEIRSAYYAQSKLVHPDKCPAVGDKKTQSAEAFHRLTQAYELLNDPVQRRSYDQRRRFGQSFDINDKPIDSMDKEFSRAREIFLRRQRSRTNYYSSVHTSSTSKDNNYAQFVDPRILRIWYDSPDHRLHPHLKWFLILAGIPLTGSVCYFVHLCEFRT